MCHEADHSVLRFLVKFSLACSRIFPFTQTEQNLEHFKRRGNDPHQPNTRGHAKEIRIGQRVSQRCMLYSYAFPLITHAPGVSSCH
ncbi:hypothetical protein B1A65_09500 [Corynebacterium diphtheriae]|nr:hypothetical protein B1A65_09500 [Corynebacterium diphtheriae]